MAQYLQSGPVAVFQVIEQPWQRIHLASRGWLHHEITGQANTDAVPIGSGAGVGAHRIQGTACLYSSIGPYDGMIADTAPILPPVPIMND